MLEHEAGNLYREVCKRYNMKPTWDGHCEWRDCLKGIEYDEAVEALNEYAKAGHKGAPFGQTIYKLAMSARRTKTNSLSSDDPYPSAAEDNRHFLEWMAAEEGRTPEEMEKHINEFMNEWEKNR